MNLYRPSNKMLDFQIPLNDLTAHEIIIPNEKMIVGRWNINVNWKYRGEDYLYKKEIVY
ncbi:FixH family protein [Autumnicola musiva]|uniref:FixH family protein n=1 Tax=Autumnicola musiva TaxID=3075589 RepID=A0ABU3DBF1_9FLAO|nr:FixH family protein [Zunongwangia sp. F117]MDT0678857.1 FixH family protein [Zunongwangia sp. F117]